jgi:acetyltransferase-like isoleucine patch superfamily enzyme
MSYSPSLKRFTEIRLPSFSTFRKDFNLLKTLYYNFKCANYSCPVLIYPKVHIHISPSAKIIHKGGRLKLGLRWNVERYRQSELIIRDNAILEIHDDFDIHTGSHIVIDPGAKLSLGKGGMNNNVRIAAFKSITIGHNVYISENATLWDSDNHPIGASSKNISAPITIGDNVLIGLNATILKGVTIGDGAVVAANSLVIRSVPPKALVGGAPAKVLRENVKWSL